MAKQALSALITIGAALEASVAKSTGFLRKELGSVGSEIARIKREQAGLDKQRTVLEKQGKAVDSLDQEYQGLGRTLLVELIARARAAGLHMMVANIEASNTASIRLHESLGFQRAGVVREVGRKFDRWLDLVILQLELG